MKRTFGWIQNPGDIEKLKKVTAVFLKGSSVNQWLISTKLPLLLDYKLVSKDDYNTFIFELSKNEIEIEYNLLKGKGAGSGSRKDAICSGIIQAVIDGQQNRTYTNSIGKTITLKKPYTDDWTSDGFLRWAISCGLIDYNYEKDTCKITDLGISLVNAIPTSDEEKDAYTEALLSYPPVVRILTLLQEKDKQTKFELGSKLGFKGELGFTSIPQNVYLCDFCEASGKNKSEIRSNEEGDSDKYARGIASWCEQMGWVTSLNSNFTDTYRGKEYTAEIHAYSLTRHGEKAIIKSRGNSSNKKISKVVYFEMLASNKAHGADYLRYQRACIIKCISNGYKSIEQIKNALSIDGLEVDKSSIIDNIEGLKNIGLDISYENDKYKLVDNVIKLVIPKKEICVKDNVNDIIDRVRPKLKNIDHKYLELIELAYSDVNGRSAKNADAREFEFKTADLFTKELSFNGARLGDSNKPDVIISYENKGTIIDNKSYKDGFNIDKGAADEIGRYINENALRNEKLNSNMWWLNFDNSVNEFYFLFITSYLKGEFKKQLDYISNANNGIKGAAIGIESLLYLSEDIKSGKCKYEDFYKKFCNNEIIIEQD